MGLILLAASLVATAAIVVRPPSPATPTDADATVAGPIQPDAVMPGAGLPVAISSDARVRCVVGASPSLAIGPLAGGPVTTIPLEFRPDRIAFNVEGNRLAAADANGNVAIVDVPSTRITATHRFADGVNWLGWAGWQRDAVVVQSGSTVQAFFKTRNVSPDPGGIPEWVLEPLRNDVVALATLPGTEGIVSLDTRGMITMWSVGRLTEDVPVRLPPMAASPSPSIQLLGWKSRGLSFVVQGRRVAEFAPYHGAHAYEAPAAIESIVWPTESQCVFVAEEPGGKPRLLVGDSGRPGWSREFDLGGARVEALHLLTDRRVAAVTSTGQIRIYAVR